MAEEDALVNDHYNAQTKANMKHRTPTISPLRSVSYYKTILGASSVGRRPFLPSPNCGHPWLCVIFGHLVIGYLVNLHKSVECFRLKRTTTTNNNDDKNNKKNKVTLILYN